MTKSAFSMDNIRVGSGFFMPFTTCVVHVGMEKYAAV